MRRIGVDLRISGPLGPCGTDAVVITGIFARVAILASAAARARSSALHVADGLEQPALMIDKQHDGIIHIDDRT